MAIDLAPFLDPAHCAVIVFECQENVIGAGSQIPGLVQSVQSSGMLSNIAGLLTRAREHGARVFYCTAGARHGGLGRSRTPLTDRTGRAPAPAGDTTDTSVVKEIAPEPGDAVIHRGHGMSGFYQTELDPCLRDLGVSTVVVTGVSLNIGVLGTALEAVNHGYRTIVATDCVAGDPPEYGEMVLRYSIRNLAYLSTSTEIASIWESAAR